MKAKPDPWLETVPILKQLFIKGACRLENNPLAEQVKTLLCGIAAPADLASKEESPPSPVQWIAAKPLLELRQRVATDNEAVAAILATVNEIRSPWLSIIAARVKEAAGLKAPEALVQLVSQLGDAASWVEASLPGAKLAATPWGTLERELFGTVAELAPTTPVLCRVLSGAAWLKPFRDTPITGLKPVDPTGQRPDINWCRGRLLGLPEIDSNNAFRDGSTFTPRIAGDFLLTGDIHNKGNIGESDEMATFAWVLATPWAFLLTCLVYAQDSWAAEQRGGILLELPGGQNPFSPTRIQLLVVDKDENEVLCGTLSQLIVRFLESRWIHLFPAPPRAKELDTRLGPVVQALLTHRVWRYYDGLSDELGYYRIDPDFADLCYRRLGSRIFQRYGRTIWQDFRILAEEWRQEKSGAGMNEQTLTLIRGGVR